MRIGIINHKVSEGSLAKDALRKIESAVQSGIDIVVAGDYALSNNCEILTLDKRKEILEKLKQISLSLPNTLILPGTIPWISSRGFMSHSCPVFLSRRQYAEFYKETDCGESELARKNDLSYLRGDNKKNKLNFNGKKIAVEICSDHGKQILDKDTWLEVIMAYDPKAGFYLRDSSFDRYALVCDSFNPIIGCFRFERERGIKVISPAKRCDDFEVYKLK